MGRWLLFILSVLSALPALAGDGEDALSAGRGEINARVKEMRATASRQEGPSGRQFGAAPAPPSNPEELRALYNGVIFPGVSAAIKEYGSAVTKTSCNLSAGFTLTAFRKLGVQGMIAREGSLHVYNQMSSGPSKGLIFDGAMAQFFKEGSPPRLAFTETGFVGTEDDLRKMLVDNIEHWDFPDQLPPEVYAAAKGTPTADLTQQEAMEVLGGRISMAQETFFSQPKEAGELKKAAEAQDRFYDNHDRRWNEWGTDKTGQMRSAYKVLDERLAAAQ